MSAEKNQESSGQNTNVLGKELTKVLVLEEVGSGETRAWYSMRKIESEEPVPLTSAQADLRSDILHFGPHPHLPMFRILEYSRVGGEMQLVLYAPFNLDSLYLPYKRWVPFPMTPNVRCRYEHLADLSRHIRVLVNTDGGGNILDLEVKIGDLRAIDSDAFAYLPGYIRDAIEKAIAEL